MTVPTWLTDIANLLVSNNYGVIGNSIFYNSFDSVTNNCIILSKQAGFQELKTVSKDDATNKPDLTINKPELGIRVRNKDGLEADRISKEIHALLDQTYNKTIGSTFFLKIEAIADPFFVSKDLNTGTTFSINFYIEVKQ